MLTTLSHNIRPEYYLTMDGRKGEMAIVTAHSLTVPSLLHSHSILTNTQILWEYTCTTRQKCNHETSLLHLIQRSPPELRYIRNSGTQEQELQELRNSGTRTSGTQEQELQELRNNRIRHTARLDSPSWCAPPIGQQIDAHRKSDEKVKLKLLRCCCAHARQEKLLLLRCCCAHAR